MSTVTMGQVVRKIQAILVADSTLQTALGGAGRIRHGYPNEFIDLPIVTHFILNQANDEHGDNSILSDKIEVQIDSWTDGSTAVDIADNVDTVMVSKLWRRYYAADVFESDSKIKHWTARYERSMTSLDI